MTQPAIPPREATFTYKLHNGQRYRVARWSSERTSSPPLLFFSGIGANIELLAPFLERLHGREVITFDVPGIGLSDEPQGPYRLSAMASVAAEILADEGLHDVDVMGVSWGGMLAQEFAYRHGDRVRRLILAATSPGMPMIPGSPSTILKMIGSHRYASANAIETYLQTLYGGSSRSLESYAARMQTPSPVGYMHQVLAIIGWTSVRKLTRVKAETLILMGDEDRLVPPANGHILKFLLAKATMEMLAGAGHLFLLTHLEAAARLVTQFLNRPETLPIEKRLPALAGI